MNISRIRNNMLTKQAAVWSSYTKRVPGSYEPGRGFTPDSTRVDQTRVYRGSDSLPGGAAAPTSGGLLSGAWRFDDAVGAGFRMNKNNPERIGALPYQTRYNANNGKPFVEFRYPAQEQKGQYGTNSNGHYIKIDPTRLPNFKSGMRLLEHSYDRFRQPTRAMSDVLRNVERDRVPFTVQPYNNEQVWGILGNDPDYLKNRMAHFNSIPESAWEAANLQLSSPEEIEAWKKYTVPVSTEERPLGWASYGPSSGTIYLDPSKMGTKYDERWGGKEKNDWYTDVANGSYGQHPSAAASWPGWISDAYLHEFLHQNTIGQQKSNIDWNREDLRTDYKNYDYNPNEPIGKENMPTMLRPRNPYPVVVTQQQLDWAKDHAIDPYAVNEDEVNQAFMSMNAGRHALKRDMEADKDNPNYKQIDENTLNQFKALPDSIGWGDAGRQQFDKMMQLFIDHPELRTLVPENSRLVYYYQNLKAAVDNAKTPEEKQYFQNLMDMMIYNKSFLANNQQRPNIQSYTDYKQMYA